MIVCTPSPIFPTEVWSLCNETGYFNRMISICVMKTFSALSAKRGLPLNLALDLDTALGMATASLKLSVFLRRRRHFVTRNWRLLWTSKYCTMSAQSSQTASTRCIVTESCRKHHRIFSRISLGKSINSMVKQWLERPEKIFGWPLSKKVYLAFLIKCPNGFHDKKSYEWKQEIIKICFHSCKVN